MADKKHTYFLKYVTFLLYLEQKSCLHMFISRESHFQLQVLFMYAPREIITASNKHTKIPDFVRFKALVTGFDFCKRCHH